MKRALVGLSLCVVACQASAPPPAAPPPAASAPPVASSAPSGPTEEVLAADQRVTMKGGASYPFAKGWRVVRSAERLVASDPERGLELELHELENASAAAAIADAWQRREPGIALVVGESLAPPPGEWDEVVEIQYKPAPGSTTRRLARAHRKGTRVWVSLVDGELAAHHRRGAELGRALRGLKVPGVEPKTFAGKAPVALDAARLDALRAFVEESRAAFEVPGVAVAVVQGGKVVFADGFGRSRTDSRDETSADTPFLIGSVTKGLTTLLMAKAVDDGLFAWDTPVKKVWPAFALGDAALTETMTMRHLVCACTGIPRQDMELGFRSDSVTPEALLASLVELKPTTGLGETFQYNNQLVAVGGYLAARAYYPNVALRDAWKRAIREKVLEPLGMRTTTPDLGSARGRGLAGSHARDAQGVLRQLASTAENWILPVSPSGGLASSANDMAKYLLAELARGKASNGKAVVSEANVLARRTPSVAIDENNAYGLGLVTGKVSGVEVVWHTGGTAGQHSLFAVFPTLDLGLVVLANAPSPLGGLVQERLLALVFDAPAEDALKLRDFTLARDKQARVKLAAELAPAEPPEVLERLYGTYVEPKLGRVQLRRVGGDLVFDVGVWSSRLGWKVRADGKKDLLLLDPPVAGLALELQEEAGKPKLHLDFQQHRYDFTRP